MNGDDGGGWKIVVKLLGHTSYMFHNKYIFDIYFALLRHHQEDRDFYDCIHTSLYFPGDASIVLNLWETKYHCVLWWKVYQVYPKSL